MVSPQPNQLSTWLDALFRVRQDSEILVRGMSDEQFNWRPAPGKWSVGECFHHLTIATGLMLEKIRPEIDRGHTEGITGTPPFRYQMMGGWFVRMMEKPPGKRPMPTPKNFVPPSGIPSSIVMPMYLSVLDDLREALHRSHGLALDKLRAGSAGTGGSWLKFNLAAWYAATVAHLQRHYAQAVRVTQSPGYPGPS